MIVEAPINIKQDRVNTFDVKDARQLKSSLERKVGYGYNVLSEVNILLQSLTSRAGVDIEPQAREYVLENEMTAACEAIDSGHFIWSNFRPYDSKRGAFLAFGTPFIQMLQAGVVDIEDKMAQSPTTDYTFELRRRQAELATEEWITDLYQRRQLENNLIFTISPYPEETTEQIAANLGYKPKERLAKLRFEVFVKNVRQTVELSIAKGLFRTFHKLMERLGIKTDDLTDSASFIARPMILGNSDHYLDTIVDFAKSYDALLENEDQDKQTIYFCGQEVASRQEKKYEDLVSRQRWVRETGKKLVDGIYDLDLELAVSLYQDVPTAEIAESLQYWSSVKDSGGISLLSQQDRQLLNQVLISNSMSVDAAFALKKAELIRRWSVMACVLNEKRAKQLFSVEQVRVVQVMVNSDLNWSSRADAWYAIDQMIARAKPHFLACGGALKSSTPLRSGGLFQVSIGGALESLFNSDKYGSLEFECKKCGAINKRPTGRLIPTCQSCGASVRCGSSDQDNANEQAGVIPFVTFAKSAEFAKAA